MTARTETIGAATLYLGDAREVLPSLADDSVDCCVTSPPYWGLRDYGAAGQIGLEATYPEYVEKMVAVFREVRRVLRNDGTLWLNLGDSYATGGGSVGRAPGGGDQGERFLRMGHINTQPNRMPQSNLKAKDLAGIPWRVAFALQADGWYLRQDIIWSKPNPMPESVTDRCTRAHEYLFMFSKSRKYHYDAKAIAEPAIYSGVTGMDESGFKNAAEFDGKHGAAAMNGQQRRDKRRGHGRRHAGFNDRWDAMEKTEQCSRLRNKRSVWTVATQPFKEAHFATFPPALIEPSILAGCPVGGTVLDPFGGAGTTGLVADRLQRKAVLIELNPDYADIAMKRIRGDAPLFIKQPEAAPAPLELPLAGGAAKGR